MRADSSLNTATTALSISENTSSVWKIGKAVFTIPADVVKASFYIQFSGSVAGNSDVSALRVAYTELEATLGADINGVNLFDSAGGTPTVPLTRSQTLTALGTAAAITNQGAWATEPRAPSTLFQPVVNLVPNGAFRYQLSYWTPGVVGDTTWQWVQGSAFSDAPYIVNSAGGTHVIQSKPFLVSAGQTYTLQAELYAALSAGTVELDVWWYQDTNGVTPTATGADGPGISRSGNPANWLRVMNNALVAPAGAQSARIRVFNAGATGSAGVRRVKFSLGAVDSPVTDEATVSAMYPNGVLIDSLQPAQAGADVTGSNTAAAISGQGALATQNSVTVPQIPVITTNNMILDPDLANSANFTASSDAGATNATIASGVGPSALGVTRAFQFLASAGAANKTQYMLPAIMLPCVPGFAYGTSASLRRKAGFNGAFHFGINWYDQAGTFITSTSAMMADNRSSPIGADTNSTHSYNQLVAPANAVRMWPWVAVLRGATAPAGDAWVGNWVFRQNVRFNREVVREDGITGVTDAMAITSLGTAAGFANQGPLATETRGADSLWSRYPNLLFNSGFTLGTVGWTLGGNWFRYDSASGDGAYMAFAEPASGTQITYSAGPGDWFPLYPGTAYNLQAEMLASNVTAGDFRCDIEYIDAAGNSMGNTSPPLTVVNVWWTRKAVNFNAPAGVAKGRIRFYTNGIAFTAGGQAAIRRIKVSASTADPPYSDEATRSSELLTRQGTGSRLGDGRNLNTNTNFGLQSTRSSPSFTDTWVTGPPGTVTINVAASSYYSDWGTTINLPSGTIPGCTPNTKYYVWRVQPDPTTAGTGYGASTNLIDALAVGKSYLGYWTTRASSGGAGGGGGWGNQDCVAVGAIVLTTAGECIARDVVRGMDLVVLDEDTMDGITAHEVEKNWVGENDIIRLTTESGIQLSLAVNTPITLRDRTQCRAFATYGRELPVLDKGEFRWEKVVKIEALPAGDVSHIVCGQKTFAAGDQPDRYILTHNQVVYK
jgi:hypothetical protein